MLLVTIAVTVFIILAIGLGFVIRLRTQRAALWAGAIISAAALVASLVVMAADKTGPSPAQLAFLVNVYLVVAAIGANLFASAACLNLAPSQPLFSPKTPTNASSGDS